MPCDMNSQWFVWPSGYSVKLYSMLSMRTTQKRYFYLHFVCHIISQQHYLLIFRSCHDFV